MAADTKKPDFLQPAGSINVKKIELRNIATDKKYDITPIVLEFNIFEHMNNPFITANFVITDAVSLPTILPIVGDEEIHVIFKTLDSAFIKEVDVILKVYAITNLQVTTKSRNAQYVLKAISREGVFNWKQRIRKSYANMPVHEMVKRIYGSFFDKISKEDERQEIYVSPSDGNRTIVVPNFTPIETMRFMAREAKSAEYEPSNFIFFQNMDKFYFSPFDELLDKGINTLGNTSRRGNRVRDEYFLTDKNVTGSFASQSKSARNPKLSNTKPFEYLKINSFEVENLFNMKRTVNSGGFDNIVYYINPSLSLFGQNIYSYEEDYEKLKHIAKGQLVTDKSEYRSGTGESHIQYIMTNAQDPAVAYEEDTKKDFLHLKVGSISLMDHIVANITIPGDSEKRTGELINISFPEFGATDDIRGNVNRLFSGKYMIIGLRHIMNTENQYQTVMQCVKNEFEDKPENVAPQKSKKANVPGPIITPTFPDVIGG